MALPSENTPNYRWRVKKSERGISLENFIYKQLGEWSHKKVKDAINHKRAFVNGKNVFISKWNLKGGDLVQFTPSKKDMPSNTHPQNRYKFVDVLYEDKYIICVNKPAFVDYETYMASILDYLKRKNRDQGHPYLGAMHRLDKETSGVMVFTKKKIANTLADQFRDHSINKQYLALVHGLVEQETGRIDKDIEKGEFGEGKKVRIAKSGKAKRAISEFRVMERYDHASLLKICIFTGRTHQIRIHMNSMGHPIIGDKLYNEKQKSLVHKRQLLHANTLEFKHPVTKKRIKIIAPLPKDMTDLIDHLRTGL